MGRISHELAQVMPANCTVLMSDDGTNAGLFMFIADRPADLSAGTLYVARALRRPGAALDAGGVFDLAWVRLGHATSAEIEALVGRPPEGQRHLHGAQGRPQRCGLHAHGRERQARVGALSRWAGKAAAFLETRCYAAFRGGTMAFTKMEGLALDARKRTAYVAMSYINRSMSDRESGVRVAEINAGGVYRLALAPRAQDTDGTVIDSAWVPRDKRAVPALLGADLAAADALGNTADPDCVANPGNLKFSDRLRILWIGEDSEAHINNFVWTYHVDSNRLTRVLSCPAGAEASGLQAVDDINGFAYVMSSFQHPGDWRSAEQHALAPALGPLIGANYRARAAGGIVYIAGVPRLVPPEAMA